MRRLRLIGMGLAVALLATTTLLIDSGDVGARTSKRAKNLTALDRYVASPDPNFAYRLVETIKRDGFTTYVLRLTSQQWRTPAEVDHPIWEHWLTIVQPDTVSNPTGFLFISGGSINSKAPGVPMPVFTDMAVGTHSVAAELRTTPNEPL
ncbi:MAG: PhoPQ-activated protein PqaA family protein, partial [Acidobacteriota bacterium]